MDQPGPASGITVWMTGLPSAGKSTLALAVEKRALDAGRRVEVLDGDAMRVHLGRELGYSREDRHENARRVGFVANPLARNGVTALCAVVSPYRDDRDAVRALHEGRFLEVHVSTPLEVCQARDVKGLYAKQRSGEVRGVTGVDSPYEPPLDADVTVPAHELPLEQCVDLVWCAMRRRG